MGHYGQVMRYRWVEAEGAEGPQPAKRACLPQGLEEGARSAPQLLVFNICHLYIVYPSASSASTDSTL